MEATFFSEENVFLKIRKFLFRKEMFFGVLAVVVVIVIFG